jgi:short-subunit dehydrogenase
LGRDPQLFTRLAALVIGASHGIGAATARVSAGLAAAAAVNCHRDRATALAVGLAGRWQAC